MELYIYTLIYVLLKEMHLLFFQADIPQRERSHLPPLPWRSSPNFIAANLVETPVLSFASYVDMGKIC